MSALGKGHRTERISGWLTLVLAGATVLGCPKPRVPTGSGADVHGFIVAETEALGAVGKGREIFLPSITVFLRDESTGTEGPRVTTDLQGRYVLPVHPAGLYRLCWEAPGYAPDCSGDLLTIESTPLYPLPQSIVPKSPLATGRVTFPDGTPCRYLDTFFDVNVQTKVVLLDPGGTEVVPAVVANLYGDYLIPGVPSGSHRLQASCERTVAERRVEIRENHSIDLTFENRQPEVMTIVSSLSGRGARLVPPGSTVEVTAEARDPDGDSIQYRWGTTTPGFVSSNAQSVQWTLPNSAGLHYLYVLASDGRGGYSSRRLAVSTDRGVVFSGTVRGSDGPLLDGATVLVNGTPTTTNAAGYFALVLPAESPRYILNIDKDGYASLSEITYEPLIGGDFLLPKAFEATVDPGQPIRIVEERPRRKNGTRLEIPANALVDESGNGPAGSVVVQLHTIDLDEPRNAFPGDYTAVDERDRTVGLISYGAVDISIRDGAGKSYDLRGGQTAIVRVPIAPEQLAQPGGPPATIALWWYDTGDGVWKQEGQARRDGDFYVGEVRHFSTLNMDVAFTDASCVRVAIDPARLSLPVNLRVTVPTGTGLPKVKTTTLNDQLSVIVRLPENTVITLEALDSAFNPIPTATQTINTGPGTPGAAAIQIPYPYFPECPPLATLTIGLPEDPPFAPPNGEYHFLIREGIDDATSAGNYYAAIDPGGAKATFADWKTANGFPPDPDINNDGNNFNDDAPPDRVSAVYENAVDLGFGRAMQQVRSGSDLAFYVCNYPTVDEARLDINLIACVAMEYTAPPLASRFTKFYVFDASGTRVQAANLDDRGFKFVPGLCMACHGGTYNNGEFINGDHYRFRAGESPDQGSQFLPFDLDNLEYSQIAGFTRSDQEGKFKTLNERVKDTNPLSAIDLLIDGWYAGGSATQIASFVPTGWTGGSPALADLYSRAVKPACRTCHVAQPGALAWTDEADFDNYSGFIRTLVCEQRVMPHAVVTYERMWLSQNPNQVAAFGAGGLSGWSAGDPCPCGGPGEPAC